MSSFAHVGMELPQGKDYSVRLPQTEFSARLASLEANPALWAAIQQILSPEDVFLRQRKSGELRWLAAVSRPGVRARLARLASRVNSLQRRDIRRFHDWIKTDQVWQLAAKFKNASSCIGANRQWGMWMVVCALGAGECTAVH